MTSGALSWKAPCRHFPVPGSAKAITICVECHGESGAMGDAASIERLRRRDLECCSNQAQLVKVNKFAKPKGLPAELGDHALEGAQTAILGVAAAGLVEAFAVGIFEARDRHIETKVIPFGGSTPATEGAWGEF